MTRFDFLITAGVSAFVAIVVNVIFMPRPRVYDRGSVTIHHTTKASERSLPKPPEEHNRGGSAWGPW